MHCWVWSSILGAVTLHERFRELRLQERLSSPRGLAYRDGIKKSLKPPSSHERLHEARLMRTTGVKGFTEGHADLTWPTSTPYARRTLCPLWQSKTEDTMSKLGMGRTSAAVLVVMGLLIAASIDRRTQPPGALGACAGEHRQASSEGTLRRERGCMAEKVNGLILPQASAHPAAQNHLTPRNRPRRKENCTAATSVCVGPLGCRS